MTSINFNACLSHVLLQEGGFVNHPKDPGGATNFGITLRTLQAYRGRPVSVEDVKALSKEEAAAIYHENYWKPILADLLPVGLDLCVFDTAVNSGPARALKLFQAVMGVQPVASIETRIRLYIKMRLDFLRSLPTWTTFGRGWLRRVKTIETAALAMVSKRQ